MFGRVRASSIGSLELLEMERPSSSKIIKHDSLSIYESTLWKLKQGSHCNPRCNPEDSTSTMAIDLPEEAIATDADFSSKEESSKNMSILHFFSKCKSSNNSNNKEDSMAIENDSFSSSTSSSNVSPTSSS